MKTLLPEEPREATRLTRAGRLTEATAVIQRLLSPSNGEPPRGPGVLGRLRGLFGKRGQAFRDPEEELAASTGEAENFFREFRNSGW